MSEFEQLEQRWDNLLNVIDASWDKLRPEIIKNMKTVLKDFEKTTLEFEKLYEDRFADEQNKTTGKESQH